MNKKIFIPIIATLALFALSFTTIPERISQWAINLQSSFERTDYGITTPTSFYDPAIAKICADSFRTSPGLILKAQAVALRDEQTNYGYSWEGVAVGYGMMPLCGNAWEKVTVNYFPSEAKKYLFDKLIKNRAAQTKLYQWAKPTIIAAWSVKEDTAQAMDMFAIWKCQQYLSQYNVRAETARENVKQGIIVPYNDTTYTYTVGFTSLDWKNRPDSDAKIYAFWHRRIKEYAKTGNGFSVDDARFWMNVAFEDMHANAKKETLVIFEAWKTNWLKQ